MRERAYPFSREELLEREVSVLGVREERLHSVSNGECDIEITCVARPATVARWRFSTAPFSFCEEADAGWRHNDDILCVHNRIADDLRLGN